MSDVIFVVPVFEASILKESGGTLLLATILRKKGMDVEIYRYYESQPEKGFDVMVENSVHNILAKGPKIVSFYCRGDCYLANIRVAEKLKEQNPDLHIVFGGPQADLAAEETIKQLSFIDYCCSGEGETTVYPLFSALLAGRDISSVKGLTYRDNEGKVVSNPRPDLVENLDELPFVDYSLIPEETLDEVKKENQLIYMDVGRGCPFNCAYCSTSMFWHRRYRLKGAKRIVAEMKRLNDLFGVTKFGFEHDLFTANKKKVFEFCKEFKESGLNAKWDCSSRIDTLDEELIDKMAASGLNSVYLGIETGSPRMQKLIHKNLKVEKIEGIIKALLDRGIKVTASFMFGFPEETEDDIEQTIRLAYRLYKMSVQALQFHLCVIFPGTEYFNTYKEQLVFAENVSNIIGDFGVNENRQFINDHKELFPFYYEYRSELRDRFNGMEKDMVVFMGMYKLLCIHDPDKFSQSRMVDLYLNFKEATKMMTASMGKFEERKENEVELICAYLSTVYSGAEYEKFAEIFKFHHDIWFLQNNHKVLADVKMYNIDVFATVKNMPLAKIETKPTMVYFNKKDNRVTYVIKALG